MDPFSALLAAAVSGGVSGLMSNMGQGDSGSQGYDVLNFNDPNDQFQRQAAAAYMMDQLSALRAGQVPDWLNNYANSQQDYLMGQNRNQMFGKEGMPGGSIMDIAQSTGAMQGLGGAAAAAPTNKALSDYADRMNGINQYIATLKNNYMTTASQAVPQTMYDMSKQQNQVIGGMGAPASNGSSAFSNMGSALAGVDWSKLFGGGTAKAPTTVVAPQIAPAQQYIVPQASYGLPTGNALNNLFPMTGRY